MKKYKSLIQYLQLVLLFNSAFVKAAEVSTSESELEVGTLGTSSCYTLTKITDETILTDEDFVVTKYLGDASSGNLTPVKYLLTFKNPLGDDPSVGSPAVRYFKWSINENGNRNLVNTGPYDTAKDITAYSSNNVRLDTTSNWSDGSDVNNSFLNRGTASLILEGGAIYNAKNKIIGNINGDFIANFVETVSSDWIYGGVIYNGYGSQIKNITGNFVGNYAVSGTSASGGVIYSAGTVRIENIIGNFIGNYVSGGVGGVICAGNCTPDSYIGNIMGDFIGNYASADGGVMYFGGNLKEHVINIGKIEGDFIGNRAGDFGGAIYNSLGRGIINSITGNFISNSATKGGAIYNDNARDFVPEITNLSGDFIGNYASADGGAIYNTGVIKNIKGHFIENHSDNSGGAIYGFGMVINDSCFIGNYTTYVGGAIYVTNGDRLLSLNKVTFERNYASGIYTYGGGIYFYRSDSSLTDSFFRDNYVKGFGEYSVAQGGAIYATGSTTTFNVSEGKKIRNYGNYAEVNGAKDDANGGFLYMAESALVNFNTEKGSSYIIGNARTGYDSIASDNTNNIINKNGKGEVIVNSSMEFYNGTLNVNEGNMTVNNKLGASAVRIASGASLSAKVSDNGSTFTNAALNFSNDGTLNLVADETLASGNYEVFVFENPETVYFGNVKSYGGTFDHATGSFVVNDALNIIIGERNSVNVQSNGRILAVGAGEEDTSIVMNFNSAADVTVNSVFDTSASDDGFAEIVGAVNQEDLLFAESFAFDVENLGSDDTVSLSFFIGSGYDISQFTVYHKDAELGWELADITNLEYDGEYLSFIVDGFSSYGYVAAVPEPSTYATIIGAISLCLILSRRRN